MRTILFSLLLILISINVKSQQIEIGPTIGYGFDNIVNSKSDNERAVIGDGLWSVNYGLSTIFYFKNPKEQTTGRIGLLFRTNKRGSISEINSNNKFEFKANTFGVFGGVVGNLGMNNLFYIDAGFGYNTLDNSNYYHGNIEQTEAFPELNEDLLIKSNEVTFIYAVGYEKEIAQNTLKLFLELNGDAAISKLNENNGSYRTQSLGFGLGVRYIFDLDKSVN